MTKTFYTFFIYILTILGIIFNLSRCATVSSPTGGEKDTIPPHLVSTYPEHKSLNFKGKEIKLTFDEIIKADNLSKQLIIIPKRDNPYKHTIKKNTIILEFGKELEENTTYTFSFREGIKDITENNPAKNVKLAFSTGNYIDSLSIEGVIKDLKTDKPIKEVTVALYRDSDTLNLFTGEPRYFTQTNDEGKYLIENIKNGTYRIYAYQDKNGDLKADPTVDKFGFKEERIQLDSNLNNINVKLLRMDVRQPVVQSSRATGKYFEIKLNKSLKDFYLESNEAKQRIVSNFADENKIVRVYNTFDALDSLQAKFTGIDSLGQKIEQELYIKFTESKKQPEKFTSKNTLGSNLDVDKVLKTEFIFNKPIKHILYDSLFIFYDSLHVDHFTEKDLKWNKTRDRVELKKEINYKILKELELKHKEDTTKSKNPYKPNTFQFIVGKGAFISIEKDSIATSKKSLKTLNEEDYGIIKGKANTKEEAYILQLIDKKNEVIQELVNPITFKFINVPPGEYRLRVIIDKNNNGQWDAGNINLYCEPEPIIFFEEPLTIRANWERDNIEISF
jgi:uncharacterized protein (DUF2141 family)